MAQDVRPQEVHTTPVVTTYGLQRTFVILESWMSPCQTYHAGCCRSFVVPVTGADILRIERDLDLSFWDFACRWADPHNIIARNYVPHFHFSNEPQTCFVICLMHAESEFLSGTTKCRFLTEGVPNAKHPLGKARCGIYASRPTACRVFPTKLNDTSDLTIIHDVPERGRTQEHPAYHLCHRQWEPSRFDAKSGGRSGRNGVLHPGVTGLESQSAIVEPLSKVSEAGLRRPSGPGNYRRGRGCPGRDPRHHQVSHS